MTLAMISFRCYGDAPLLVGIWEYSPIHSKSSTNEFTTFILPSISGECSFPGIACRVGSALCGCLLRMLTEHTSAVPTASTLNLSAPAEPGPIPDIVEAPLDPASS